MITAELSVIPVGTGTSIGKAVKKFVQILRKNGLKIIPGPTSTVVEATNVKELFEIIDKAHNGLFDKNVQRVVTTIRIDDRRDKNSTLEYKLKSIQ